ncbi:Uncharacterized conserved protein [Janthinobacterium sp. Marseille]|nr:TIGR02391 family protein [Janthinobacterium sp. Marseille]ABR91739.1 Uncharacterized conserved protein [Janthinobacterium sp. Marseille]
MMAQFFTDMQLQAIANALGDTSDGLTGSEIDFLLAASKLIETVPAANKRGRIYNAFAHSQNTRQDRLCILAFIRKSMKPSRYLNDPARFETLRHLLNEALAFAEMAVIESGALVDVERATTIVQAKLRADELRADMIRRGVHPDVLKFCRTELVANNYFHAVLEAVKSVLDKIRTLSGLTEDGVSLIEKAIGGTSPLIQINQFRTDSEVGEQKGFANFLKGLIGMFRNTTAHEARVNWPMAKEDAEDLLSAASLAHRRLDRATIFPLLDKIQ